MNYSAAILGSSVAAGLMKRQRAAVLTIGRDTFERSDLAGVSCFHFLAAVNLSRLLKEHFQVRDTKDVFENVSPERLAIRRLGAVSLAVLGAAFEAKKIGGGAALETWYAKHRGGSIDVTFATLKHHDDDAPKAARKKTRGRFRKG